MLLLTVRGTPVMYYGDELGMLDAEPVGTPLDVLGRDVVRAPMPWTAGGHHDFCPDEVAPWLPFPADAAEINVQRAAADPGSMLSLYRRLITVRRTHPALRSGEYQRLDLADGCLVYLRTVPQQRVVVALNFTKRPCRVPLPWPATMLISTHPGTLSSEAVTELNLAANAGMVLFVQEAEHRR